MKTALYSVSGFLAGFLLVGMFSLVHAETNDSHDINAGDIRCDSIQAKTFTLTDNHGNARIHMMTSGTDAFLFVNGPGHHGQPQIFLQSNGEDCAIALGDPTTSNGSPLAIIVDKDGAARLQIVNEDGKTVSQFPFNKQSVTELAKTVKSVEATIKDNE